MKRIEKIRGDHFRFDSVFIKKSNQTETFLKKTETSSNPPVSVRFGPGFLEQKPVQTGLTQIFQFGSVFSIWLGFSSVFSVWLGFGSVFLVFSGWLGFFRFGFSWVFSVLGL